MSALEPAQNERPPLAGAEAQDRPRCLIVRPRLSSVPLAGDEIVYARASALLGDLFELVTLPLEPAPLALRLLNIAMVPELARYATPVNKALVARAVKEHAPSVAVFFHEVTFPFAGAALDLGAPVVLHAHNSQTAIALSEPSFLGRLVARSAKAFEQRYYLAPGARLVCISRLDAQALGGGGSLPVASPGASPEAALTPSAPIAAEAVILGTYAWWRKRRDLRTFARQLPITTPLLATDPLALALLGDKALPLPKNPSFFSEAIRFGVITDRFAGGFKLKSTEYVAKNCIVLSMTDLSAEFSDLPHANLFVRYCASPADIDRHVDDILARDPAQTSAQFRAFKAACLNKFDWRTSLAPLVNAAAEACEQRVCAIETRDGAAQSSRTISGR